MQSIIKRILSNGGRAVSPWPFAALAVLLLILLGAAPLNPPSGESSDFFLILLLVYLGGIYLIWKGLNSFMLLRYVKDTPTSEIGSMASGDVEVKGETRQLDEGLQAPFSGEDCVCYEYIIEEYRSSGKSKSWQEIARGRSDVAFAVEDGTDAAAVDPEGAELRTDTELVEKVDSSEKPRERIREFNRGSSKVDPEGDSFLFSNPRRYKEKLVRPGTSVYIYGEASRYTDDGFKKIRKGSSPIYIISDRSEEEIIDSLSTNYKFSLPIGVMVGVAGYAGLYLMLI